MSYCFMVLYIPANFPSVYLVENYSLRSSILVGTVFTSLGIIVRCLVNVNFYTLFTG